MVFGKHSGFNATFSLSSLNGKNGFRLDGETSDDLSGWSVNGAGDVNGDGFDDLIVGAPFAGQRDHYYGNFYEQGYYSGSSYLVFGKSSDFEATLDLSSLDSSSGFRLDGPGYSTSGWTVSTAGDLNGDGFDDVIIGAPASFQNGGESARYVVFGKNNFSRDNVINGTFEDEILKGTPSTDIFWAFDGNDTLIGNGGADAFNAGLGNDHIKVADLDFGLINGGNGSDVLHLDGSNLNLNLSVLGERIRGIEAICLYGRGDNTLTLMAEDVINLSDSTNTLKVHGNAGDKLILNNEWVDQGSHGFYHIYAHDHAILLVGQNMVVEFV